MSAKEQQQQKIDVVEKEVFLQQIEQNKSNEEDTSSPVIDNPIYQLYEGEQQQQAWLQPEGVGTNSSYSKMMRVHSVHTNPLCFLLEEAEYLDTVQKDKVDQEPFVQLERKSNEGDAKSSKDSFQKKNSNFRCDQDQNFMPNQLQQPPQEKVEIVQQTNANDERHQRKNAALQKLKLKYREKRQATPQQQNATKTQKDHNKPAPSRSQVQGIRRLSSSQVSCISNSSSRSQYSSTSQSKSTRTKETQTKEKSQQQSQKKQPALTTTKSISTSSKYNPRLAQQQKSSMAVNEKLIKPRQNRSSNAPTRSTMEEQQQQQQQVQLRRAHTYTGEIYSISQQSTRNLKLRSSQQSNHLFKQQSDASSRYMPEKNRWGIDQKQGTDNLPGSKQQNQAASQRQEEYSQQFDKYTLQQQNRGQQSENLIIGIKNERNIYIRGSYDQQEQKHFVNKQLKLDDQLQANNINQYDKERLSKNSAQIANYEQRSLQENTRQVSIVEQESQFEQIPDDQYSFQSQLPQQVPQSSQITSKQDKVCQQYLHSKCNSDTFKITSRENLKQADIQNNIYYLKNISHKIQQSKYQKQESQYSSNQPGSDNIQQNTQQQDQITQLQQQSSCTSSGSILSFEQWQNQRKKQERKIKDKKYQSSQESSLQQQTGFKIQKSAIDNQQNQYSNMQNLNQKQFVYGQVDTRISCKKQQQHSDNLKQQKLSNLQLLQKQQKQQPKQNTGSERLYGFTSTSTSQNQENKSTQKFKEILKEQTNKHTSKQRTITKQTSRNYFQNMFETRKQLEKAEKQKAKQIVNSISTRKQSTPTQAKQQSNKPSKQTRPESRDISRDNTRISPKSLQGSFTRKKQVQLNTQNPPQKSTQEVLQPHTRDNLPKQTIMSKSKENSSDSGSWIVRINRYKQSKPDNSAIEIKRLKNKFNVIQRLAGKVLK